MPTAVLQGGGGAVGLTEATQRSRFEGFTTDSSRNVDLFAIDVNPVTGQETLRRLTTVSGSKPVRGHFVLGVLAGQVMPPTREYMVKSRTGVLANVANGLTGGQCRRPVFDYIFPENSVLGEPIVPKNFEAMLFLAQGSGPLSGTGPVVGQLDPWPGLIPPPLIP